MPTTSRLRAARDASPPKTSREHNTTAPRARSFLQHDDTDEFPDTRKTKRQKLEIRGPKQQTLDSFVARELVKPPIKIAELAPGGPVVETINGVQHEVRHPGTNGTAQYDAPAAKKQRNNTSEQNRAKQRAIGGETEKRTLRSQDDGPRLKSELATYFSNYEDIIFDTNPQEPELLNIDTTLYITTEKTLPVKQSASPEVKRATRDTYPKFDLDLSAYILADGEDDPLSDRTFMVAHKRAERKEKQMRNIEREHAMHEKAQLDRLLDGLLGHDWLRVLGITGVTEGEAKKFESKRRYFIQEVQGLVDKFKEWREEERRQRLEKAAADREALHEEEEDDDQTEISTSNPPSSDLNASASRQLQQETASAIKKLQQSRPPPPPVPFRPPSPITSFYSARHLRDSALKKARNSRNQLAFGLLVPDVDEEEFALPSDYLSEDVLRASARERRRRKRETVSNAA